MTTEAQPSDLHLSAARKLLDELKAVTEGPNGDAQTKAMTAAAHAILVLAEQVAVIRVLLVGDAVSRRQEVQPPERS